MTITLMRKSLRQQGSQAVPKTRAIDTAVEPSTGREQMCLNRPRLLTNLKTARSQRVQSREEEKRGILVASGRSTLRDLAIVGIGMVVGNGTRLVEMAGIGE